MFVKMGTPLALFFIVSLQLFHVNYVESKLCTSITWFTYSFIETKRDENCWFWHCYDDRSPARVVVRNVTKLVTVRCPDAAESDGLEPHDSEPKCSQPCINGYCLAPDRCTCNDGYIPDPKNNNTCMLLTSRQRCQCEEGYQYVRGFCAPICSEPCINGTCTAPEYCQCLKGYKKTIENLCKPYCSMDCTHGTCIAPETCLCNDGYVMRQSIKEIIGHSMTSLCQPKCLQTCVNGKCVAPNTCECLPGFIKSERNVCKSYTSENPTSENSTSENPTSENPTSENPTSENSTSEKLTS